MKRHAGHIQLNVGAGNISFYTDLYASVGWDVIVEDDGFTGVRKEGWTIWFTPAMTSELPDHDAIGLNHIGIEAESIDEVDRVAAYLRSRSVELLYGTPCHRPEFAASETDCYYSVMFESPDRILLEIVYTGPAGSDS